MIRSTLRGAAIAAGALPFAVGVSPVSALTVSKAFKYTGGEQTYTVPAGVSSVRVVAVGGHGGDADGPLGGASEWVRGQLKVTPGETLYVEVGGNGGEGREFERSIGAFNGGGAGGVRAGGGGGASDVRTAPRAAGLAPDVRLIVAGGGGGGGATGGNAGGRGGAAGEAGEASAGENQGGGAGQSREAGKGGHGCGENGTSGVLGAGGFGGYGAGTSNSPGGGGGGGGTYGGGGGAGSCGGSGGGGGGGSSLIPAGGSERLSSEQPRVEISYERGP
ncbi:MAG: glycine-rich protein [Solirubrobacteraceae bacterium]